MLAIAPGCAASAAIAAAERWRAVIATVFQNYGREQGLPPLVPTAIAQDGDGFLWIGTQGGLVRWDGYRFREYDATPGAAYGLPGGWIEVLHADAAGRLWIGTAADGLARYDRDQDRFTSIPLGPAGSEPRHIGAIGDDGAGGIWVGADSGLYHLDANAAAGSGSRRDDADPPSLPGERVQAVRLDRAGRLWVGAQSGLLRLDPGAAGFARVPLAAPGGDPVAVSALFEDRDGRIWIGATQHGLYATDPGGSSPRPFGENDSEGRMLRTARVSAIAAAGDHEIWVATRATGIVAIDIVTGQTAHIRHDRLAPSSLAHDDIWAMASDHAGSVWVGGAGGLSYHPRDTGVVSNLFGDTTRANGVTDPDVASVLAAADGRIWLGFLTGGVDIVDPAAGRVAQMRPDSAQPETALPQDVVTEMTEADDGDIYVGTARGVYRVAQGSHDLRLAAFPGRDPHGFVRALLADGATLWIGGPDGLWRAPIGGGAPENAGSPDHGQFSGRSVFCLLRGSEGDLWIGAMDGLYRLELASGRIETINADPANPETLPAPLISSLVNDLQGRLWVGTFGGGIAVMTGRDPAGHPQFRRIGVAEGLPHPNVDRLLRDSAGMIWASTDDGLAVIDPNDFNVRAIGQANGAVLTVYWVKSGATDLWGEPLFGAKGGLAVVQPGPPAAASPPAPVAVTDIRIAGRSVAGGRFNGAGSAEPLLLTHDANSVALEFSALDFTAPEHDRYAYRLEGFDRDWTQTDATRRVAAYTNLPPGDYVLKLRGSNRDGEWAPPEREIPIRVLPAWRQTVWARLAFAAIILATLLAAMAEFVRRRTAYLRRRQAELEQLVAARTADLRAANDRLSELATTDPLTGCANRRRFMERARELVAIGRGRTPVSLAIMDLDNFKLINDSHGHPVGDEVLCAAARISRDHVRATELVGRIGGEEFAILMPNTRIAEALGLAERLRSALADAEIWAGGRKIRTTASLGLAEQQEGEEIDSLYARADAALYAAKQAGRNRVVIAAPSISPAIG